MKTVTICKCLAAKFFPSQEFFNTFMMSAALTGRAEHLVMPEGCKVIKKDDELYLSGYSHDGSDVDKAIIRICS